MTDEKKLYTLMVQAEDLQEHTKLLNEQAEKSQKVIDRIEYKSKYILENFSKDIENITYNSIKKSLITALITGVSFILFGTITFFSFLYYTKSLRNEVKELKYNAEQWEKKAGKANLITCGDKKRLCVQVEDGVWTDKDGNNYMILHGY